ncbi:hypothetical protein K1719_001218 [Acacia pycnantha]|nr:hypothetical protein K1719_001218 [Acacia pycnantha]
MLAAWQDTIIIKYTAGKIFLSYAMFRIMRAKTPLVLRSSPIPKPSRAGDLSWTPQIRAEAESFPPSDFLYMHAQDGHLYLASALFNVLENFDEERNIAQVHRATLKYRYLGQKIKPVVVAVKVRHPGVSEEIRRDLIIINIVAKISSFLPNLKWLRLDESLHLVWYYVDELEGHERFKTTLAHIGTHALLKMLLVDNFVHAVMHLGNILVRRKHITPSQIQPFKSRPHVVFLDVGMTTGLSKKDQQHLLEFFKAVAILDGHTTAECTLKFSKQQNCHNPKSFIEGVERSSNLWRVENFHPANCMQQLLECVRRHKVNSGGNICSVVVTMLVLEVCPAFN